MKVATLFSGGGLIECAMVNMGLEPTLAVERDPNPKRAALSAAIADLHELNFPKVEMIRESVERVDWGILGGLDWFLLHASPSCKSFSNANLDGEELDADIQAAKGTCDAIATMKPLYFSLENVKGYLASESLKLITDTLIAQNYAFTYDVLDAKHYGVPQSRERIVLIAHRGGSPVSMPPRQRPVSWFEVLSDRIPYMRKATPTALQKQAIDQIRAVYPNTPCFLVERMGARGKCKIRHPYDPAFTVVSNIFTDGKGANRQSFLNIWHQGEWLDLSLRDVADLQTVPAWYDLGTSTYIGGTAIGNGVPCKMYEAVLEQILKHSALHGYGKVSLTKLTLSL